jgi:hypothetical protein
MLFQSSIFFKGVTKMLFSRFILFIYLLRCIKNVVLGGFF